MPHSPRWTTILFDLDGTLIDSVSLVLASYRHTFEQTGIAEYLNIPESEIRSWIGIPLPDTFRALNPERADEMTQYFRDFNEPHHDDWVSAFPGMADLASALARRADTELGDALAFGVVTAKRRALAQRGLDVTKLSALPLLIAMEDTAYHKPNPEPLLAALEALGRGPSRAVYIGDAVTDLQAAARAGIDSIGVTWGAGSKETLEAEEPAGIAETAEELLNLLEIADDSHQV